MLTTAQAIARLGTESAFEVSARAEALAAQGRDIINLGIGQPDFTPPGNVIEAAVKALRDGPHGYTPPGGIERLREAVATYVEARTGTPVDPGCVIVVPGAKVTMFFAILMLGEPGAEIVHPDPGFPIFASMIRFTGATPVPMALHEEAGFSFDADEVLERIGPATRLIILNSPGNPTGGVYPREELEKLVAGLERHPQVCVLSDEIYGRMLYDGRRHVSLMQWEALRDRLILLDGWSKTYAMTGWRLGFGVWPPALVEPAIRLAVNSYSCVNVAAQYAGIEALTGPQDAVEAMVAAFAERRRLIVRELNALPGFRCAEPAGAFYAFPNITGTGLDSAAVEKKLLEEAGVAALSGAGFGAGGEGYVRFSYANSTENIGEAMRRIRKIL